MTKTLLCDILSEIGGNMENAKSKRKTGFDFKFLCDTVEINLEYLKNLQNSLKHSKLHLHFGLTNSKTIKSDPTFASRIQTHLNSVKTLIKKSEEIISDTKSLCKRINADIAFVKSIEEARNQGNDAVVDDFDDIYSELHKEKTDLDEQTKSLTDHSKRFLNTIKETITEIQKGTGK